MKIGLQVASFKWPDGAANIGSRLAEIACTADDAGFDSLWVMDHFFEVERPVMGLTYTEPIVKYTDPMLDSYTALGYMAGVTKRVRLGAMVTGVIYRHPGHLVKIVTSLDVLSGGRAYLGIGAGWYEREALGLGFPFPPLKERFERLEETLQIAHQMWADGVKPYQGKHYQLQEPLNSPPPLSKPHPPILIGGSGEKKTLRLVAQYADACNLFVRADHAELSRQLDVLKRYCDEFGRPYEAIERTVLGGVRIGPGAMSLADVVHLCKGLSRIGFQHFIFNMRNDYDIKAIEAIGREVIPEIRAF